MAKAVAIALFSVLHSGAFAFPSPQNDPQATSAKFQWQIYKSCDEGNKNTIFEAWEDSKKFADALAAWKPKADYQQAMDMYMGSRSTFEDFSGFDFPKQIQDTARRSRGLYDGVSEYGNANLWVYCNEDSKWWHHCSSSDVSAVLAYEQEDAIANNWYITFCPAFYDPQWSLSLGQIIQRMRDENGDPMIMENWEKSQGATFFHETMHMSQLVTSPKAKDSAYGPKLVYELARNRNTDAAVYNADSWTMAAQAILAQRSLNLQSPPFPLEHPLEGLAGGYMVPQPDKYPQSVLEEVSGFVPEGAEGTSPPFFVNPDIWEVYVAPPPVVPEPKVPTK